MKEKLVEYMKKYNLTQRDMAKLLGIGETYLSKLMNNKKKPGRKIYKKYEKLPGIQEEKELRKVLDYLMLEFSRGNLNQKILKGAINQQNIFASKSLYEE